MAHNFVLLQDGFLAQRGAEFTARIDSCKRCSVTRNVQNLNMVEKPKQYVLNKNKEETKMPINNNKQLKVSPNPAANTITVYGLIDPASLQIIDCNGLEVMKKDCVDCYSNKIVIDISKFRTGIYVIRCEDGRGNVYSEKFVKM